MEEIIEVRIGRYLSKEMTHNEMVAFEQELASNPVLNDQYLTLLVLWQNIPEGQSQEWDVESALNRFSLSNTSKNISKLSIKRTTVYWAVAATMILLFGVYSLFISSGPPVTFAYQEGSSEPIVLKDGSKIFLNKASDITVYPFKGKKRYVKLNGEAFFDVSPDNKRPFIIASGKTITEVFGTSFNILQTKDHTTIYVNSGRVVFSSSDNTQMAVALTEGEAALFKNNKMELIANPSPNINAWRTQQLKFVKNMPLSAIVADVATYFNKEIIIEQESIKACRISIPLSYKNPEINSMLNAVVATINAKLIKEGDKYIIRGGGCS